MSWFLGLLRHDEAPQFISPLYIWKTFSMCSLPLPLHRGTWQRDGKATPKCTMTVCPRAPSQYPIPHFIPGAICHKEKPFLILFSFSQKDPNRNSIMYAGHCFLNLNKLYNPGPWHFNHIYYSTKSLLRDLERWSGGNPLEASTV